MENKKVFKWSQDQVKTLLDLNTKGKSVSEIARLTKRPYGNVYFKLRSLNIKPNIKFWTIGQPEKVSQVTDKESLLNVLTTIAKVSEDTKSKAIVTFNRDEINVEFENS